MPTFEIAYEDNHLLAVVKPPMMPVQRDASGDPDLLSAAKEYLKAKYAKPGAVYLGLVHRLDRPVGGVMVFARTSKAAARLQKSMQEGGWKKEYLAIVAGDPPEEGALRDFLWKDEATRFSRVVPPDRPDAKEARLRFRTIARDEGLALLAVALETGRHHQIRVQLSHAGWPIWGDARYNPDSRPGQSIALFAHALSFPHPVGSEPIALFAPFPDISPWSSFFDKVRMQVNGFLCNI